MRRALAASAALAVAVTLGLTPAPSQAAPAPATAVQTAQSQQSQQSGRLTHDQVQAALGQLTALLPDAEAKAVAAAALHGVQDTELRDGVRAVIDPDDYQCAASTPVLDWIMGEIADWTLDDRLVALVVLLLDPVTYDALLFPPPAGPQRYGVNGEFTIPVTHTFRDLRRFWDIPSATIQLAPMHGSTLLDQARISRVMQVAYGMTPAAADSFAATLATLVNQPQFDFGDHPFFTFNAFAASADETGGTPKIIMGDGVMTGLKAVGLGDVAPQAILAHEFGHQVQFADDLIGTLVTPEDTRRAELMADAFSAYFLSHARGASMQRKRVTLFEETFWELGDCGFGSAGHHGTMNQRRASAEWAYQVADTARPQGHILPSLSFAALFEAKLPELVAPDA